LDDLVEDKGGRMEGAAAAGPVAPRWGGTGFPYYLLVHGAWFLTNGLQLVLILYLVRLVLHGTEGQLGIAQMCLSLPQTLLILVGGIIADKVDTKRQVRRLYSLATIPYFTLGVLLLAHTFNYPLMILYALSVGSISAFTLPARDALLARVAPSAEAGGLQRAVSFAALAQFSGQILGMGLASCAQIIGVIPLFFMQAGIMGGGATLTRGLKPRDKAPVTRPATQDKSNVVRSAFGQFATGIKAVAASSVIGPLTLVSFGLGICLVGSQQVLLPLMVQEYFPANLPAAQQSHVVSALAIFTLCFWLGTIVTATSLVRLGVPKRTGRFYLIAVVFAGTILLIESLHLPYPAFCFANFLWGIANGVIITLGRGIVQELAGDELRARILSVFSFAFMVGGPAGAASLGFLAGAIGPHHAIIVTGAGAIVIAFAAILMTQLWQLHMGAGLHRDHAGSARTARD
jgi:MFS family permease